MKLPIMNETQAKTALTMLSGAGLYQELEPENMILPKLVISLHRLMKRTIIIV